MFFFFTNLSLGNFLYCLWFLMQPKTFHTARTPIEMKQNLLHWFFCQDFRYFCQVIKHQSRRVTSFPLGAIFNKRRDGPFLRVWECQATFSVDFLHSSLTQFFSKKPSSTRCKFDDVFSVRSKGKKLLFNAVLGSLEEKLSPPPPPPPPPPNPWWTRFMISFAVSFINKTHK